MTNAFGGWHPFLRLVDTIVGRVCGIVLGFDSNVRRVGKQNLEQFGGTWPYTAALVACTWSMD